MGVDRAEHIAVDLPIAAVRQFAQRTDLRSVLAGAEQLHAGARGAEANPGGAEVDVPVGFHVTVAQVTRRRLG